MNKVTIGDFNSHIKVTIDEFTAHFRRMHDNSPQVWPVEASFVDWYNEFISYLDDKIGDCFGDPNV